MEITSSKKDFWHNLLNVINQQGVSDVLFCSETKKVYVRIAGSLKQFSSDYDAINDLKMFFPKTGATDFGLDIANRRFRANIFHTFHGVNCSLRPLPVRPFTLREINISQELATKLVTLKYGLILVTGPTGSGKSSTLCTILETINNNFNYHIITIEDPIEFVFQSKKSIFSQREVGRHTTSFSKALKEAMRENPDVIYIGELRDYETVHTALMAADTGHLIFSTLHTKRVYSTISRILEMCPQDRQSEIRNLLSNCLSAVLCQRLVPKINGGMYPLREIMLMNPAISNLIREGKERVISDQLVSKTNEGMISWEKSLEIAVQSRIISQEQAYQYRDTYYMS